MHRVTDQDTILDELERFTVAEAAARLGVSQDAVRKRIHRNTLPWEKDEKDRIYVYLDPSEMRQATVQDTTQDAIQDAYIKTLKSQIEMLQDQLGDLRTDLEDWKRVVTSRDAELDRKDHLIAQMNQTIQTLAERLPAPDTRKDIPLEASEAPQKSAEGEGGTGDPIDDTGEPRASWWKRFFGFE